MALLLPSEAAAYLRVSKKLLYTLAREGRLPCIRIGRVIRFRQEVLEEWAGQGGTSADVNAVQAAVQARLERQNTTAPSPAALRSGAVWVKSPTSQTPPTD